MSLKVDSGRRGRSRSPGARDSKRDSSRGPAPIITDAVRMPSPPRGYGYSYDSNGHARTSSYDFNNPHASDPYNLASPSQGTGYYRPVGGTGVYPGHMDGKKEETDSPLEKIMRGAESFLPAKYANQAQDWSSNREEKKQMKKDKLDEDLAYGSTASLASAKPSSRPESIASTNYSYAQTQPYAYAKPDERLTYSSANYAPGAFPTDPRSSAANIVSVEPSDSRYRRDHSPLPSTNRLSTLSVNGPHHSGSLSLSAAPPSPLLESYQGTYQSMSPMPSPLLLATNSMSNLDIVEPLSPSFSDSDTGDKKKRRARFHDPEDDAKQLAQALKGDRLPPDTAPLIELLPGMTHRQIMELRQEYKRLVKTGAERKGVNVAKHIRSRLKDSDEHLMKACYATALGKWESDAYWASFWYQGDKTRRELLIEALMGRTNTEIRAIKDAFKDKRYHDSLTMCMKTELKEDKFKKAVLLVLDERRMEDRDAYGGLIPIDRRLVESDVSALRDALKGDKGGETAMIQIVVTRSDAHLRDVLRLYERTFGNNFARDALTKSTNLVGELLAHILNGIINRPVRDALLLHHALNASRKDGLRRELLTSRLVRFHWDPRHMAAIKRAYRERYRRDLADEVKDNTSGEWGLFCRQLVIMRMPDDVKSFNTVEVVRDVRKEERERQRERELMYERERRDREREREREYEEAVRRERKEREREKERGRAGTYLVVGGDSKREKSRERSRSRSRRRE